MLLSNWFHWFGSILAPGLLHQIQWQWHPSIVQVKGLTSPLILLFISHTNPFANCVSCIFKTYPKSNHFQAFAYYSMGRRVFSLSQGYLEDKRWAVELKKIFLLSYPYYHLQQSQNREWRYVHINLFELFNCYNWLNIINY